MLTADDIEQLSGAIELPDGLVLRWVWSQHYDDDVKPSEAYLQVLDPDLPVAFQAGRKWRLSHYMTRSEVVQTAMAALMAWYEHEAREGFKYKGLSVFSPHLDVEALHEIVSAGRHEFRPPVPEFVPLGLA